MLFKPFWKRTVFKLQTRHLSLNIPKQALKIRIFLILIRSSD